MPMIIINISSFELTVEARESGNNPLSTNVTVRIDVKVNEHFIHYHILCLRHHRFVNSYKLIINSTTVL